MLLIAYHLFTWSIQRVQPVALVCPPPPALPQPELPVRRLVMPLSDPAWGSTGWMSRGACHGQDPELFFPIAARGPALRQISAAKAVCGRCAVLATCLSYALATMQVGVWGGTTGEERLAMASRPEPAPARGYGR